MTDRSEGGAVDGLLTPTSPAAIDAAPRTNLTLPARLTRACLKPMLARWDGVSVLRRPGSGGPS